MSSRYRTRGLLDRRRLRVLDLSDRLRHESGPRSDRTWSPDRVALMAHWSRDAVPTRSVVQILSALDRCGFETVLVSAAPVGATLPRACTWAPGAPALPDATTILRRENIGYDFGSWAAVLAAFPGVADASRVLLLNDSVIGPLNPLDRMVQDFDRGPEPVWGLVASQQHRPHLQSFFLGFRDGVLQDQPLQAFWRDIRVERSKAHTVRFNELGLAEVLDEAGIGWRSMDWSSDPASSAGEEGQAGSANPTLHATERLLAAGFPFVKVNAGAQVLDAALAGRGPWLPPGFDAAASHATLTTRQRVTWEIAIEGPSALPGVARSLLRRG